MADVDSVRVAIRIRPMVKSELDRGCQQAVVRIAGGPQIVVNGNEAFTFNYVFDSSDTQGTVYSDCVSEIVDQLFGGFNGTILAYGQTGSGKTHTMGTAYDGDSNENVGVIPRAMKDIFRRINELAGEYDFVVTCSFMELYQEQLYDLLSPERVVVEMREDRNGVIVPGLTEQVVTTADETTDCLVRGSSGRAVASTAMNLTSSRSHAIFTVTLQAIQKGEVKTVTTSKFHLVDLAGSERSKKTQATGDRFKEGVKINQGLLALGNVISALGAGQGSGFVRYRDSKLTRLLQDSLGGNSITLMIACVSPADYNVSETMSTLRYADRARKIKNKPIVNQDPHAAEVNQLKGIIQKLRLELLAAGGNMSSSLKGTLQNMAPGNGVVSEVRGKMYQELQEKYRIIQRQLQATLHDVAENEMRAHIAEAAHETLKAKTDEMKSIVGEVALEMLADETITTKVLQERIQQIQKLVDGLDEELERTQSEITDHKRRCSINDGSATNGGQDNDEDGGENSPEMHELMQEQTDAYTNKQIDFKEQLRRINRELNLKEEVHQRVAVNLNKFCTLDDNIDEKFKECETKILELEAEKSELQEKLRHVKESNTSAKLAEERRKRLQTLEHDITEMKRKNMQQAKLLKVREKEKQKIQNLNTEIQSMKESKVKLIRAMRQESENFRQWKMTREKELMHLKNKDRKLQNEMARKEAMHTKQRNVLKRKCEEAMAANKRLKDALERQSAAQSQRQKPQLSKDNNAGASKIEQLIGWVERELDVMISLIDAEHSLEQLMEDRVIVKGRIEELQAQQPTHDMAASQELANLLEEIEIRNAQIADLQQKVCAADLDTRMRSLCESIQSVSESRAVLRHLFKSITDMRREYANRSLEQKATCDEQRSLREAAEEQCTVAAKRMRLMEIAHEEAIAEREGTYEEKIAVLLRELHNAPQMADGAILTPEQEERLKIQEEQLNKMDTLREELETYKQLVTDMQNAVQKKKKNSCMPKPIKEEEELDNEYIETISSSSEGENDFNVSKDSDPDWMKTPLVRKKRISNRRTTASENSETMEESFATAANTDTSKLKRKHKHSCSCRGTCSNNRCGCHSSNEKCTSSCRCADTCLNVAPPVEDSSLNSEKSETVFAKPDSTLLTPKLARLSTISFDTASVKKKFFQ